MQDSTCLAESRRDPEDLSEDPEADAEAMLFFCYAIYDVSPKIPNIRSIWQACGLRYAQDEYSRLLLAETLPACLQTSDMCLSEQLAWPPRYS